MKHMFSGLLTAGLLLAFAGTAVAAPVTVDLRIEGKASTLYEGKVTTDVAPFAFTAGSDTTDHRCDGTDPFGSSPTAVPTRGAAISVAAHTAPFTTEGTWYSFGPAFTKVAGEDVSYDSASGKYLAEYKN